MFWSQWRIVGLKSQKKKTEHSHPFYFLQKLADSGDRSWGRGLLLGKRITSKVLWSHITGVTNWRLGGRERPQAHSRFSQQDIGRGWRARSFWKTHWNLSQLCRITWYLNIHLLWHESENRTGRRWKPFWRSRTTYHLGQWLVVGVVGRWDSRFGPWQEAVSSGTEKPEEVSGSGVKNRWDWRGPQNMMRPFLKTTGHIWKADRTGTQEPSWRRLRAERVHCGGDGDLAQLQGEPGLRNGWARGRLIAHGDQCQIRDLWRFSFRTRDQAWSLKSFCAAEFY